LKPEQLIVLLEYMKVYESLGKAIHKHCDNEFQVEEILAIYKGDSGDNSESPCTKRLEKKLAFLNKNIRCWQIINKLLLT
jgi:hypothetical protein